MPINKFKSIKMNYVVILFATLFASCASFVFAIDGETRVYDIQTLIARENEVDQYENPIKKLEGYVKILGNLNKQPDHVTNEAAALCERLKQKGKQVQQAYAQQLEQKMNEPSLNDGQVEQLAYELSLSRALLISINQSVASFVRQKSYLAYMWQYQRKTVLAGGIATVAILASLIHSLTPSRGKQDETPTPPETKTPVVPGQGAGQSPTSGTPPENTPPTEPKSGESKPIELKPQQQKGRRFVQIAGRAESSLKKMDADALVKKSLSKPLDVSALQGESGTAAFIDVEPQGPLGVPLVYTAEEAEIDKYKKKFTELFEKPLSEGGMGGSITGYVNNRTNELTKELQLESMLEDKKKDCIRTAKELIALTLSRPIQRVDDPINWINTILFTQLNISIIGPEYSLWQTIKNIYTPLMNDLRSKLDTLLLNDSQKAVEERLSEVVEKLKQSEGARHRFYDGKDRFNKRLTDCISRDKTIPQKETNTLHSSISDLMKAVITCDKSYIETAIDTVINRDRTFTNLRAQAIKIFEKLREDCVKMDYAKEYKDPKQLSEAFEFAIKNQAGKKFVMSASS